MRESDPAQEECDDEALVSSSTEFPAHEKRNIDFALQVLSCAVEMLSKVEGDYRGSFLLIKSHPVIGWLSYGE